MLQLRSLLDELDTCSLGLIDRYNNVLLTLNVTGNAEISTSQQETTLPERPYFVKDFLNIPDSDLYPERYTVEFSFLGLINRQLFSVDDNYR